MLTELARMDRERKDLSDAIKRIREPGHDVRMAVVAGAIKAGRIQEVNLCSPVAQGIKKEKGVSPALSGLAGRMQDDFDSDEYDEEESGDEYEEELDEDDVEIGPNDDDGDEPPSSSSDSADSSDSSADSDNETGSDDEYKRRARKEKRRKHKLKLARKTAGGAGVPGGVVIEDDSDKRSVAGKGFNRESRSKYKIYSKAIKRLKRDYAPGMRGPTIVELVRQMQTKEGLTLLTLYGVMWKCDLLRGSLKPFS